MLFLRFVLEPIYKIFAHCLGEEKDDLAQTLAEVRSVGMFGDIALVPGTLKSAALHEALRGWHLSPQARL